jgi:hypothetical protein
MLHNQFCNKIEQRTGIIENTSIKCRPPSLRHKYIVILNHIY